MKLSVKNALYQAILNNKWLSISYVNNKGENTDYFIGVIDIDGGEHIGSRRTAKLDREKENICSKYGIKLIRIPNSAVKDYESIISLFEFVVKDLPNIDQAYEQMSLLEE